MLPVNRNKPPTVVCLRYIVYISSATIDAMGNIKLLISIALVVAAINSGAQQVAPRGPSDYVVTVQQTSGPQPRWLSMPGSPNAKWTDGVYKWYFNPANVPPTLTPDAVLASMKAAAAQWTQMCNIDIKYMGVTDVAPGAVASDPGINVWGFAPVNNNGGGFALSAIFPDGHISDADIILNTNTQQSVSWDVLDVQGLMTHEIGHGIGIGHSDVSESIMYAESYHDQFYSQYLRGDDVAACVAKYGESVNSKANRVMNWAEKTYPMAFLNLTGFKPGYTELQTSPPTTIKGDGYIYRYYPTSNSYLGAMKGDMYYKGPDGVVQNVGKINDYMVAAASAGF